MGAVTCNSTNIPPREKATVFAPFLMKIPAQIPVNEPNVSSYLFKLDWNWCVNYGAPDPSIRLLTLGGGRGSGSEFGFAWPDPAVNELCAWDGTTDINGPPVACDLASYLPPSSQWDFFPANAARPELTMARAMTPSSRYLVWLVIFVHRVCVARLPPILKADNLAWRQGRLLRWCAEVKTRLDFLKYCKFIFEAWQLCARRVERSTLNSENGRKTNLASIFVYCMYILY